MKPHGSQHYCAKLTENQAREIYVKPRRFAKIVAHEHGVSESVVKAIWTRRTWKHATKDIGR